MITINDIETRENVDYEWFRLLEGHLLHEVRRKGRKGFVKEYGGAIEDFARDYRKIDFCYLLALLEYLDPNFRYDESVRTDKYVVNLFNCLDLEEGEEIDLDRLYAESIPAFTKRGFIRDEVDGAWNEQQWTDWGSLRE